MNQMPQFHDIKEYLNFNRGERRGLVVLFTILATLLLANLLVPWLIPDETEDFTAFENAVVAFEARKKALMDSVERQSITSAKSATPIPKLHPFYFDPNGLSLEKWLEMGLSEKQARVIKNYEKKGGRFESADDLAKIYSISDKEFRTLRPFIRINSDRTDSSINVRISQDRQEDSIRRLADSIPSSLAYPIIKKEEVQIEVNRADSTALLQLRGIGPVFSTRIVEYRELLGGFVRKDQLLEVYGMDSVRFAGIADRIVVDSTLVRKININKSGIRELTAHPYIEFFLAKSIVRYREAKGEIGSLKEFGEHSGIPDAILKKVGPYLEL